MAHVTTGDIVRVVLDHVTYTNGEERVFCRGVYSQDEGLPEPISGGEVSGCERHVVSTFFNVRHDVPAFQIPRSRV